MLLNNNKKKFCGPSVERLSGEHDFIDRIMVLSRTSCAKWRDRVEIEYIAARHTVQSHSYSYASALDYTTQSETSEELVNMWKLFAVVTYDVLNCMNCIYVLRVLAC